MGVMHRFLQDPDCISAEKLDDLNDLKQRYTVVGDPSVKKSAFGDTIYLDGIDDTVEYNYGDFVTLASGTIAAWVWLDRIPFDSACIFSASDGDDALSIFDLRIYDVSDPKLIQYVYEASGALLVVYATEVLNYRRWYHVAFTDDATGNALYLNGEQAAVAYLAGNAATDAFIDDVNDVDNVHVGTHITASALNRYFAGSIRDMLVYNRALTPAEIADLYYHRTF